MTDQADDEREEGTGKSPTRNINIRVEADLIEAARRIGECVGLGYQTILKTAARVGLRQFIKARRFELDFDEDIAMPVAPLHDLEGTNQRPGPDETVVHDRPLPRIR
jgi:hypothetical protein